MLLAIDIGNTTVSAAVLKLDLILYRKAIEQKKIVWEISKFLIFLKKKYPLIDEIIICSVVPSANKLFYKEILKVFRIKPKFIGTEIKVPIKNNYKKPMQVGQDRLVCAHAARLLYKSPLIIIDLGTAITVDVVSAKGEYEGGMIIPGIKLSLESLYNKTELLPQIKSVKIPESLIGKDTNESILSGIFFGYGAMINKLIDMISKEIKKQPKIIVTGGFADIMKKFISKKIDAVDSDLIFKGISFLKK